VARLTAAELRTQRAWFGRVELPPGPFRSTPWPEIPDPECWRAVVVDDLYAGIANVGFDPARLEARRPAKRSGPPEVQAAAHTGELEQPPKYQF
jgi:hypothetical protein